VTRDLWYMWNKEVSDEVIESIIFEASKSEAVKGVVGDSNTPSLDIRSSTIRWVHDREIRSFLKEYIIMANSAAFGVDLNGHCEIQYTEYYATERGHYDWHHDVFWNAPTNSDRKLSIVIQLSNPDEYEGGNFEFSECENPEFKNKGSILVFPSYLKHRVTPVTKGTRKSLVSWFFGPRWR